jgi:Fe-S-cluster-containing dehydrogenase component/DMSO reductase anchor subunit
MLDELLDEQRRLPAVERFSAWHDRTAPGPGARYSALLPASVPAPGQQYAFEVNLDACTGCKACVAACHALNGLEEHETWRSAGLLVSENRRHSHRQTVTTACHHCVDPGCANGCPVLAYEKDENTGIVRHLDDQCIGCNYCTMTCSYGVPQYLPSRGIVRKCDMCRQRLDEGEAPACVQACPSGAIRIVLVEKADALAAARNADVSLLPGAPPSRITVPSTRYVSREPVAPTLIPEQDRSTELQPAHWPLVLMLVFSQAGAGALATYLILPDSRALYAAAALAGAGNVAAILHLGRPLKAWRAWMGWRKSWLSREIITFGLHVPPLLILAAAAWLGMKLPLAGAIASLSLAAGIAGIFCSGMVYHVTQRPSWVGARSLLRFALTALLGGAAAAWCVRPEKPALIALVIAVTAKLAAESHWHRLAVVSENPLLANGVMVLNSTLGIPYRLRFLFLLTGGLFLPAFSLPAGGSSAAFTLTAAALLLAGEILERLLFFRAAMPWHMPGWTARHHS